MAGANRSELSIAGVRGRTSAALRAQPLWLRVGGAILVTLAAFFLSLAMHLPQQGYTFLLLYPVVIASAYFAGRHSGIAATATAATCVAARIVLASGNGNELLLVQVASLVLFLLIGFGSSELLSRLKRALRELERSNAGLIEARDSARLANEQTDLLLRELRHRIRNDLSNICAILRLQAKSLGDGAAAQLVSAADRLQVLARVHERLSREGHSPVVEMKPFLEDLCSELRSTLLPLKPVALETDIDEVKLPSGRAVAAGLIVNELLTNSIKYAYPGDREGLICVYLECEDSVVELGVDDDGVGLAKGGAKGSGLGHRLVRSLAAQLGGRFECDARDTGTRCVVVFPVDATPSSREQLIA